MRRGGSKAKAGAGISEHHLSEAIADRARVDAYGAGLAGCSARPLQALVRQPAQRERVIARARRQCPRHRPAEGDRTASS